MTFPDEGGEVVLRNHVSALYDSNILGRESKESDVLLSYKPTLEFTRDSGIVAMDAEIGGDFGFFTDNSDLNYEDFTSRLGLKFPNDEDYPYEAKLSGSHEEISDLDRFLGERLESNYTAIDAELRYDFTERWAIGLALGWSETSYQRSVVNPESRRFFDLSSWQAGGRFIYNYSDNLDWSVGYTYTESDAQVSAKNHAWVLNVNGQLSPKVQGSLGIGYNRYESTLGDFSDPHFSADLTWQATDEFAVKLGVRTDYRTTATGEPVRARSADLRLEYSLKGYWLAAVGIGYEDFRFEGGDLTRTDDLWFASASFQRILSPFTSLKLGVRYEDQDSSEGTFSFDRVTAEAGLIFAF